MGFHLVGFDLSLTGHGPAKSTGMRAAIWNLNVLEDDRGVCTPFEVDSRQDAVVVPQCLNAIGFYDAYGTGGFKNTILNMVFHAHGLSRSMDSAEKISPYATMREPTFDLRLPQLQGGCRQPIDPPVMESLISNPKSQIHLAAALD